MSCFPGSLSRGKWDAKAVDRGENPRLLHLFNSIFRRIKNSGDKDDDVRWYVPPDEIVQNTAAHSGTTQGSGLQHSSFHHSRHSVKYIKSSNGEKIK